MLMQRRVSVCLQKVLEVQCNWPSHEGLQASSITEHETPFDCRNTSLQGGSHAPSTNVQENNIAYFGRLLRPRRQGRELGTGMQVSLGIMLAPVTYLTHCTSIVVLLAKLRFDTVGHVAAHSTAQRPSHLLRKQKGCQGALTTVPCGQLTHMPCPVDTKCSPNTV